MNPEDDSLFGWSPGAARREDPDTSHGAAQSVNATKLEQECWEVMAKNGDMTAEEIAMRLGYELGSVTPRLAPLVRKKRVSKTAIKRPGKSGRPRIVWHAEGAL